MQANNTEHVTGRRLDVNGGNIVLFRGLEPKLNSGLTKRNSDQDMLEYVRAQEQKIKLEKLKWRESDDRIAALQQQKTIRMGSASKVTTEKDVASRKERTIAQNTKAVEVAAKPTIQKPKPSPKFVAEVIEQRNRRASEWLHKEQLEVRNIPERLLVCGSPECVALHFCLLVQIKSKKAEILDHKRAAKELDLKRRQQEHQEAERRRLKQLQMFQDDPVIASAIPLELEVALAVPPVAVRPPPSVEPVLPDSRVPTNTVPEHPDPRMSHNAMVIEQVAAQLQLHAPSDHALHHTLKRPGVPRLSKGYVSKAHLLGAGEGDDSGDEATHPQADAKAEKTAAGGPTLLPRRAKLSAAKSAVSDDSDGYGEDEDFEPTGPGEGGGAVSASDTALVQRLINSRTAARRGSEERKDSDGRGERDTDSSGDEGEASPADAITERTEEARKKRREEGKQYADRRRRVEAAKEAKLRQEKALEEKKRQQALTQLQSRVISINKRTKHTTGTDGASRGSATYRSDATGSTPHVIRAMVSQHMDVGSAETDRYPAPASPLDKLLAEATDQLRDQGVGDIAFPANVAAIRERTAPSSLHGAVRSPPRYAMVDSDADDIEEAPEDLRDLHPSDAGGWQQFMREEEAHARAAAADSIPPDRSATPPRDRGARLHGGRTASPARNSASPPVVRRVPAVGSQDAPAIRKPSPPPFRFNSWQPASTADRPVTTALPPPRVAEGKPAVRRISAQSRQRPLPVPAPTKSASATLRQPRKPALHPKPISATQHLQQLTSGTRSRSAGSAGVQQRRSERTGEPDNRPPSRARSAGRSRSVFHADVLDQDALDLFDHHHVGQSSEDEVQYGEPEPLYNDENFAPPAATGPAEASGLGGYLSKSPARGFGAAPSRRPDRDISALWGEVPRYDGDLRSQEEQRLLQEVSEQSFRNFEQVTRVLHDVDRWCEQAKQETLQLKERLKMRESMEFTPGMASVQHQQRRAQQPLSASMEVPRGPPRAAEREPSARQHRQQPQPGEAVPVLSPPDAQDIAVIRHSLAGRLSSRAQELFNSSSSSPASSDTSHVDSEEHSIEAKSSHYDEAPQGAPTASAPAAGHADRQSTSSVDEWRKQNAAVRAKLAGAAPRVSAVAPEKFTALPVAQQAQIERKLSQEEMDDSVLMGDLAESRDSDVSGSRDSEQPSEDSYLARIKAKFEGRTQHSGPPVPVQAGNATLVQLHTSSTDRPLLWSAGSDHSTTAFAAKDPLLAQQLGMAADRNELVTKFASLGVSSSSVEYPRQSAPTATVVSPSRYRHSEEEAGSASENEDWTKPLTRPSAAPQQAQAANKHLPSLRNVGELAGLLRSTYRAELETEAGRSALLDATDSDSDGLDDSSELGGDYDNYSAVSIMAARIMAEQARATKAKEEQLVRRSQASAGTIADAAPKTDAQTETSRSTTEPAPGYPAEDDEPFWAETLVKPERQLPDEADAHRLDESGAVDELLHDFNIHVRHGLHGAYSEAAPGASGESQPAPKIRYTGAEMRMRMMEELRKQDELFHYTLELAELEKTHAMQQARDLAMQAQQRSAEELADLQQRQELEMQRLAYENSIALSLVTAQNAMDRQSAEQREQVLQLQSRMSAQDLFRQYQELLHQADNVAGNLDQNQKLLEMERLLQEDRAREVVAELENKHAAEKAAMMLAHAEVQKAHAEALVEASRKSMELLGTQQQHQLELQRTSIDAAVRASFDGARSQHRGYAAPATLPVHREDSADDYEEDEYSTQFETEASVSMRSRTAPVGRVAHPAQGGAEESDSESIPEESEGGSPPRKSANYSLEVSDSMVHSPDAARDRELQQSTQSGHHSVSTASRSGPTKDWRRAAQRYDDSASEASEVEDSVQYGDKDDADEVGEDSAFESYADSPLRASARSGAGGVTQSYSRSSRAFEVSEVSRSQQAGARHAIPAHHSQSQTADFEVEDSTESVRTQSAADEVPDESGGGEQSYSDTFEGSGSKASKGSRTASTISTRSAPAALHAPKSAATGPVRMSLNVRAPRANIPALDSSSESGAVLADSRVPELLDGYRAEMEERLRAQEQTYKLKVQLLKAKQAQRLEWLEKVRQNRKVSSEDLAEEEQRTADVYAEERAQVERERWALNARAYKELRKFKRLRRDLLQYQANMQNSAQAAAELEANLIDLRNRRSEDSGLFPSRTGSSALRRVHDSSSSVTSSSQSAPARPLTRRAELPSTAVAAKQTVSASRTVPAHETDTAEEDEYGESDFEEVQSMASKFTATSARKAAGTQSAAAPKPVLEVSQSHASYEESYEASAISQPAVAAKGRDRADSIASEVSEESIRSAMDDSGMESEDDAEGSYRPEPVSAGAAPPAASSPLAQSAALDASDYAEASYYTDERGQSNAAISAAQVGTPDAPSTAAHSALPQKSPEAEPEEDEYDSYGEDFVQESDHGSVGRPGLSAPSAPLQAQSEPSPQPASPVPAREPSPAPEESDIESEISAYGRESDDSDEPYYLSTSVAKVEGALLAPIDRFSPPTVPAAEDTDKGASPAPGAAPSTETGTAEAATAAGDDEPYSEEEFTEDVEHSGPVAQDVITSPAVAQPETPTTTHIASTDADEVQYEGEDFADYQSDEEDASPAVKDAGSRQSTMVPTAMKPAPVSAAKSEDDESVAQSIGTSIAEEEDLAATARLDMSADSHGSADYLTTSRAAATSVDEEGHGRPAPIDVPSPTAGSPARVASVDSASTKLSIQTASPMRGTAAADSVPESVVARDPEVDFWGSEDFLESPGVLNRKTAGLVLHHAPTMYADRDEPPVDPTKQMHFDPDQQRWVGGEEVSLDGFDESVADVMQPSMLAPADRGEGSFSELEDSGAEESRGSASEHEGDHRKQREGATQLHPAATVPVGRGAGIAEKGADEYASDEFSEGGSDTAEPAKVNTGATTVPSIEAEGGEDEGDDEVPDELEESLAEAFSDDEGHPQVPGAGAGAKPDLSMALSEASFAEEVEPTSASNFSGLLSSSAVAMPSLPVEPAAIEESTLEASLSALSIDYVESVAAPGSSPGTGVPKPQPEPASPDDSLLDAVLDMSFEDNQQEVASEATEFAEIADFSADYVEDAWPMVGAQSIAQAREVASAVPDSKEREEQQEEEESRLALVEDVTDILLDVLVQTECARVLSLVPVSGLPAAEPKRPAGKRRKDTEKEQASKYDVDEEAAADLLAENMMRHSSKFNRAEQAQEKEVEPVGKSPLSSLGALPSLSAPGKRPHIVKHSAAAEHDPSSPEGVQRPAEFGAEDEELYEFDIPTRVSGTGETVAVGVGAVGPDGIVHPPHGTEGSAKDEPQAGAALVAAVQAAETMKARCARLIVNTKVFFRHIFHLELYPLVTLHVGTSQNYLDDTLSQPELFLAEHIGDPSFQVRTTVFTTQPSASQ
jgi:hypothetical protein